MKLMGLFFTMLCLVGGALRAMDSGVGASAMEIPQLPRARTYAKAQFFATQDRIKNLAISKEHSLSQRKLPVSSRRLLKHGGHEDGPLDAKIGNMEAELEKCEANLVTYASRIRRGKVEKNKERVAALSLQRDAFREALANCEVCVTAESADRVLCEDCGAMEDVLENILHELAWRSRTCADNRALAAKLQSILVRCSSCSVPESEGGDACSSHGQIAVALFELNQNLELFSRDEDGDGEVVVDGEGLPMTGK